jgi:hypothetical protein
MKLSIIATSLTALSAELMTRTQRLQLEALIRADINEIKYPDVDVSILNAFKKYTQNSNFKLPADVPTYMVDWFNVQTGRSECVEDCEAGVLDMSPLWGYGCWCFFGNIDSTLGRGPPIDAYDSVCKDMTLCYRCIIADAESESDSCDPYNVTFESTLSTSGLMGLSNVTATCSTDNVEPCSWRTCSCAMTMVTKFFNLSFGQDGTFDENLQHKNGFDYQLECPQQGKATDRQCCGFYPNRRTYDRGEARDCCHEKSIYNPLRHQCCDDGSYTGLGGRCE